MSSIAHEKKVSSPEKPSLRLRLSRAQRLRTPGDYRRVYQSKQWGGSTHHSFNVNASSGPSTLGVTVSKKVSKSAVTRNRIKRQIKEFYRARQLELINAELVITAKPSSALATDYDRRESLELLWEKILKWQRWHQRRGAGESKTPG